MISTLKRGGLLTPYISLQPIQNYHPSALPGSVRLQQKLLRFRAGHTLYFLSHLGSVLYNKAHCHILLLTFGMIAPDQRHISALADAR
jgi:hypothetical protein